jgi:release factor glutamine methyltransferase
MIPPEGRGPRRPDGWWQTIAVTIPRPESGHSVASDPLVARLRAAGCVFAEDEARLLREAESQGADLEALVGRRLAGEPLEYVVGWAEFCGLRVDVSEGVFVPRRRSELVVREAVALLNNDADDHGGRAVVVDLCCGSGAIGAAIAHAVPRIELHSADVEPDAVDVARGNIARFGGEAHLGDLFTALPRRLRGQVRLIAANAPYVPSSAIALMPPEARDHEPLSALDGGPDGLDLQRRVAQEAPEWLAPDGWLLIETSKHQSPATAGLLRAVGLDPRIRRDPEIGGTVVVARRPPA